MNTATRIVLAVCLGMLSMVASAATTAKRSVIAVGLYPQQVEFSGSTAFIRGFVGGRGSGKTRSGAYAITKVAKKDDPWMCVSPDAGVVTETTLPTFLEVCETLGIYRGHKLTPYPKVKFATRDGGIANIIFRSGEKPKKLHGPNKAGLWLDEASLQSKDVFLDTIPTLRWRGKMGPCLMTFTPKGKKNWTFATFFEEVQEHLIGTDGCSADGLEWIAGRPYRKKPNTHLVHATSRDNPFLPEQFYDVLAGNMSRQLALQELEGNFIEIAGLMFQREWFELVDEAPRDALRVRYWDKASTPLDGCYTAGLLMAMDPRGICYIEDVVRGRWSYRERDVVIEQVAEADFRKYQGEVIIVAEQEGGSGGKEVMHQMITNLGRFPVQRDIVSGKQSRKVDGIELPGQPKVVRAMPLSGQAEAGNIKLVRGRYCQDFLDELCSFPESTYCDQVDACFIAGTKVSTEIGDMPIEQVQCGTGVLTRNGLFRVKKTNCVQWTGNLVRLRWSNGSSFICTGNHEIWTTRGFMHAADVQLGQIGMATFAKPSHLMDSNFIDIQRAKRKAIDVISAVDAMEFRQHFTASLHRLLLVENSNLRKLLTMSMEMSTTMHLPTWKSWQRAATPRCISKQARLRRIPQSTWHPLEQQLVNGMGLMKGDFGIPNTQRKSLPTGIQQSESVSDVKNSLSQKTQTQCFAPASVKTNEQRTIERFIGTFASYAEPNSWQQNDSSDFAHIHVVEKTIIPNENAIAVFDLTIDGPAEYFADGVLVHNCSGAFNRLKGKIHAPRKAASKDAVDGITDRFGALAALKREKSRRLFGLNERRG